MVVMNGATPTQYTPLESLLFFQALRAQNLTAINFESVSGELNNIPLVRDDAAFDASRLSPHALQDLYLKLVKEEARRDLEQEGQNLHSEQNGGLSPNSRKRKLPSPTLPTVEEAAKHSHLLPRLLLRLYTTFREASLAQIKEEERKFDQLNKEIVEIQQGGWDERLRKQQQEHAQDARTVGSQPTPEQQTTSAPTAPLRPFSTVDRSAAPSVDASGAERRPSDARPSSARASIDAIVHHTPMPEEPPRARRTSTVTTLPPLSEMAPEPDHSPQLGRLPSQHMPAPRGSPYQASPPLSHHSPYAPYPPQAGMIHGASPSPKLPNAAGAQSPSSPQRMLPVLPGMKMAAPSPVMQNGVPPGHRQQQPMQPPPYTSPSQRPPQPHMPSGDRQSIRGYPPTHLPTPPGYHQQQNPAPYPPYQSPQQPYLPPQQSQYAHAVRPSQQGGFQLPPFQVSVQEPTKVRHQQPTHQEPRHHGSMPQPATPGPRQYPPGPYGQYPPYTQPVPSPSQSRHDNERLTNSVLASLKKRRPTWKAKDSPSRARPTSPTRPAVEPNSPVRKPIAPVHAEQSRASEVTQQKSTEKVAAGPLEPPPKPVAATKKQTRRNRGASAASSTVASSIRGRTRSQSVASQLEEVATPAEKPPSGRKVKHEPSTPAEVPQEDEEAEETTPAKTRQTRSRKNTIPHSTQSSARRRRQTSPIAADDMKAESAPTKEPPRNDVVYATRNFQRISAVLLNDITAHRHAGPFQKPVSNKDVEGYKEIIKRPQDLKSIKAAITAGSRAIASATAKESTTDSPAGTPAKEASTLTLEKTIDLISPKAIVNSGQLEKEIMRMFANAVMFNPGNDGIVQDAREMAEDIEARIRDWRNVERQPDDEEETATAKRRKV